LLLAAAFPFLSCFLFIVPKIIHILSSNSYPRFYLYITSQKLKWSAIEANIGVFLTVLLFIVSSVVLMIIAHYLDEQSLSDGSGVGVGVGVGSSVLCAEQCWNGLWSKQRYRRRQGGIRIFHNRSSKVVPSLSSEEQGQGQWQKRWWEGEEVDFGRIDWNSPVSSHKKQALPRSTLTDTAITVDSMSDETSSEADAHVHTNPRQLSVVMSESNERLVNKVFDDVSKEDIDVNTALRLQRDIDQVDGSLPAVLSNKALAVKMVAEQVRKPRSCIHSFIHSFLSFLSSLPFHSFI
jgi:hypothetical protein